MAFWTSSANANYSSGTGWASISGGTPGSASVPDATNDARFDSSSATNCTIGASAACLSLDCTGYIRTLGGAFPLAISGSLTLGAGMNRVFTGPITFAATDARTITCNGVALDSGCTFSGVGGTWQLQDDFATGSAHAIIHNNGTLDTNGKALSAGTVQSSGLSARTLTIAGSTITLTGPGGNLWDTNTTSNLTLNVTGSRIVFANTSSTDAQMLYGPTGLVFEDLEFAGSGTGKLTLSSVTGVLQCRNLIHTKTNSTLVLARRYKMSGALKIAAPNNVVFNGTINKRYKTPTWVTLRRSGAEAPAAPTLTAPTTGGTYNTGDVVTFSATSPDSDIDHIDFVLDPGGSETVIGTDSSAPYSQDITISASVGAHTVVARAVRGGLHTDSAPIGLSIGSTTDTLLIYWGQSNTEDALGTPAPFSTFTTSNGKVWYWIGWTDGYHSGAGTANGSGSTGNSFVNAGLITTGGSPTTHYPPHLHGLRAMATAGINAQAILVAQNATRLYDDWDPAAVSGRLLFNVLKREVDAALAAAAFTLSSNCRIIWHSYIGESDSQSNTYGVVYQARYQAIMDALKAHYPAHTHYFVINKTNSLTTGGVAVATIRAAQDALALANPNTYTVESDDEYLQGNPHFSPWLLGYMAWKGLRAARGVRTLGIVKASSGSGYSITSAGRTFVGASPMTVVCYMLKTTSGAITQTRWLYKNGYNTTVGFQFEILAPTSPTGSENAKFQLDIADGGGVHRTLTSGNVVLQQNKIHQVAFTHDGTNIKFWLDGEQIGTTQGCVGYTSGAFSAFIGGYPSGSTSEIGIAAIATSATAALSQAELQTALTNAKASDDFSMAHQTTLLLAGQAGGVASGTWRDSIALTESWGGNAGIDYAVMEADYAT